METPEAVTLWSSCDPEDDDFTSNPIPIRDAPNTHTNPTPQEITGRPDKDI